MSKIQMNLRCMLCSWDAMLMGCCELLEIESCKVFFFFIGIGS